MTTEEALAELEIEWPWGSKLSCPKHSDSDPSLHLYPNDKGWYCFSCNKGGDGWGLLSHYLDVPVSDLMRARGVKLGPRPRSRFEQLAELEGRARKLKAGFQVALGEVWSKPPLPTLDEVLTKRPLPYWEHRRRFYKNLQLIEDRVDAIYGDSISARYFPEDMLPYQMEQTVTDLEGFYQQALADQRRLREMVDGL